MPVAIVPGDRVWARSNRPRRCARSVGLVNQADASSSRRIASSWIESAASASRAAPGASRVTDTGRTVGSKPKLTRCSEKLALRSPSRTWLKEETVEECSPPKASSDPFAVGSCAGGELDLPTDPVSLHPKWGTVRGSPPPSSVIVPRSPTGKPHFPAVDIASGATPTVLSNEPEESPEVSTDAPSRPGVGNLGESAMSRITELRKCHQRPDAETGGGPYRVLPCPLGDRGGNGRIVVVRRDDPAPSDRPPDYIEVGPESELLWFDSESTSSNHHQADPVPESGRIHRQRPGGLPPIETRPSPHVDKTAGHGLPSSRSAIRCRITPNWRTTNAGSGITSLSLCSPSRMRW